MDFIEVLDSVNKFLSFPVLVIVLAAAGLFFTIRTRFVQIRLFGTACKLIMEKPSANHKVSSFQALMVSTASRVGTGNIVGVSDVHNRRVVGIHREYARSDLQAEGQKRSLLRRSRVLH